MNTPLLCSVLIPTYKRLDLLRKVIRSIIDTANDKDCFEIIVRVQTNDPETLAAIPELVALGKCVRIITGDPLGGYGDLSRFYDDCAALAMDSEFIWVGNDDAISMVKGWDEEVMKAPKGHILVPEIHGCGFSTYMKDQHCPFMFFKNKSWKQYGMDKFSTPFDSGLWQIMRANGWGTYYLPGIHIFHVRDALKLVFKD
jgi:hypothetical protein